MGPVVRPIFFLFYAPEDYSHLDYQPAPGGLEGGKSALPRQKDHTQETAHGGQQMRI